MWVDDNHVDVEIGDDHTGIFQAFLAAAQAAQKCVDQIHSLQFAFKIHTLLFISKS